MDSMPRPVSERRECSGEQKKTTDSFFFSFSFQSLAISHTASHFVSATSEVDQRERRAL